MIKDLVMVDSTSSSIFKKGWLSTNDGSLTECETDCALTGQKSSSTMVCWEKVASYSLQLLLKP